MEISDQKQKIRQELLERRQKDDFDRTAMESKIIQHIQETETYRKAQIIALYSPILGEVDLMPLARKALEEGKNIAFPLVEKETSTMQFARVQDFEADFDIGEYGIHSGKPENVIDDAQIDLYLVPGVAFDKKGNRLGMGQGYFDRYFERTGVEVGKRVGVGFGFQVVEELPVDEGDQNIGALVIENGLHTF